MRLSNKSTFSLTCLVLLFAFATAPVMADSMSATWSADVNTTEGAQPGWNVTLTVVTAPGLMTQPQEGTATNASITNRLPAVDDITATTKVFTFAVQLEGGSELLDSDVIAVPGRRRVTLTNGRNLGSTSIYTPKLKKITAPKSAQAVLTATIEFESQAAPVAAVTTTPTADAVPGIGPATGLRVADITAEGSQVISLSGGPNTYTVQIILGSDAATSAITLGDTFPSQDPTTPGDETTTVIRDVLRPSIGTISIATRGNDRVPAALVGWSTAFDVTVSGITDTPVGASTFDLKSVRFTVTPVTRGATVTNVGTTSAGIRIAQITPKVNSSTDNWDATTITITVTAIDLAGNTSIKSLDVLLAARSGTGAPPVVVDPGSGTTPTVDTPETGDPSDPITIPKNSYVIVGKTATPEGLPSSVDAAQKKAWGQIPDLEDLFFRGGTILLTVKAAADGELIDHDDDDDTDARQYKHRDVIITEIMWALNNAAIGGDRETARQWIEVYNALDVPVNVILSGKYGRTASTAPSDEIRLDRISNVVSSGWKLEGLGQNGFDDDVAGTPATETTPGTPANYGSPNVDFISMYRTERGKDGWVKGHWAQSTEIYLSGHKGTPGTSERGAVGTIGATGFTVGAVIFNEIANRDNANRAYEWIELRNRSGGTQNLKNWEISIVTGVGSDTRFFAFPNSNRTIPAGGHLLLVDTDPRGDPDHPLATGWNIGRAANDQVNGVGAHSARYMVADFDGNGLPDNGLFVLILRNHNNKRGSANNLIDIAGYVDGDNKTLTVSVNEAGFTNLWPLSGDVRPATLSNNKLEVNKVHRRQRDHIWGTSSTNYGRNNGNHHDDAAFRDVGWTSLGYRRKADRNNVNGGTPGYDNGALLDRGGDAKASIVISEIMLDISRNLPQWIEIQNLSNTKGVTLTNASLFIVNHSLKADGTDYTESKLSETIDLNDVELPPNQVMLIVANASRSNTRLPDSRIVNLRRGRGEKLLNSNGFQITLKLRTNEAASRHETVDIVGNLGAAPALSRRVDDQSFEDTLWDWPAGVDVNGNRLSIARRTSSKVTSDGTAAGAWVSSESDSRLSQLRELTFYGHSNDISSPGQTVGAPVPVSLSFFRPTLENGEIVIRWTTESELDNAGFNILRSDSQSGEFKQVNSELVQGAGTTGERNTYKWVDESAKLGVVYYYQIEDVSFAGERQTLTTTKLKGLISANNKLTTLWGGLKSQQD